MHRLESALDRLHARTVRVAWLRLFAAMTRGLLAIGFIIPGVKKFGGRFTTLPLSHPVGFFFEAMYRAHGFYLFVGMMQVLAGVLLLFPHTATLGAIFYFPLIVGIFIINLSVGFSGTYVITGMMLLAAAFLLCWDYDRLKGLLPGFGAGAVYDPARHLGAGVTVMCGAAAGVIGIGAGLSGIRVLQHQFSALAGPLALTAAGVAIAGMIVARHGLRAPSAAG